MSIRQVFQKGTKIFLTKEVTITGRVVLLEEPIEVCIKKVQIQESHNDSYGEYWPEAIKYTGKTISGEKVLFWDALSHRVGYVVDSVV